MAYFQNSSLSRGLRHDPEEYIIRGFIGLARFPRVRGLDKNFPQRRFSAQTLAIFPIGDEILSALARNGKFAGHKAERLLATLQAVFELPVLNR